MLVLAWIGAVGLAEFNDVGITAAALIFATKKFKNAWPSVKAPPNSAIIPNPQY